MSTNKTQNYHLHAWEPTDDFQLSEINENFASLETALHDRFILGSYVGGGTNSSQRLELALRPRALLIARSSENEGDHVVRSYALALPDGQNPAVQFDDTGVTLSTAGGQCLTFYPAIYHYMVIL